MPHLKFDPEECDFWYCNDMEAFLKRYPPHISGKYMPQPFSTPDRFPVWITDVVGFPFNNPNGADHLFLFYLYSDKVVEVADPVDLGEIIKAA